MCCHKAIDKNAFSIDHDVNIQEFHLQVQTKHLHWKFDNDKKKNTNDSARIIDGFSRWIVYTKFWRFGVIFFPVVSEEDSPRLVALLWTGINTIQNPEEASSPEFKMMMPHYLEQTCTSVQLNYPNNQNQHKTPVKSDV